MRARKDWRFNSIALGIDAVEPDSDEPKSWVSLQSFFNALEALKQAFPGTEVRYYVRTIAAQQFLKDKTTLKDTPTKKDSHHYMCLLASVKFTEDDEHGRSFSMAKVGLGRDVDFVTLLVNHQTVLHQTQSCV
jgi:hypothetical protein